MGLKRLNPGLRSTHPLLSHRLFSLGRDHGSRRRCEVFLREDNILHSAFGRDASLVERPLQLACLFLSGRQLLFSLLATRRHFDFSPLQRSLATA